MRHLLGLCLLLRAATACTTTTFNSTYKDYPDCAASCLACTDSSYSRNFANNCDFESGDCCISKYHTVIAETWSCVGTNCGDTVSQEAFSTFVQFCKDKKHALQEADVPQGYSLTETEGNKSITSINPAVAETNQTTPRRNRSSTPARLSASPSEASHVSRPSSGSSCDGATTDARRISRPAPRAKPTATCSSFTRCSPWKLEPWRTPFAATAT